MDAGVNQLIRLSRQSCKKKEVSSKYPSSDSDDFWPNPARSNYNSKYIYLSKDNDLDNAAKE